MERRADMQFDVVWTADEVREESVAGSAVVVIDVLRATTMIAALLDAGAHAVWPVTEVEEARALAARLDAADAALPAGAVVPGGTGARTLLAGERGGLPPAGFDLGNSPLEVNAAAVAGRRVVLTTTNGTRAINRSAAAAFLVAGAFVNAGAVVRWLAGKRPERVYIVCAGTGGRFSLDDALCAGMILARLDEAVGSAAAWSDAARAAAGLYERYRDELPQQVAACAHGRNLAALGLREDVVFAVQIDRFDVVPVRRPDRPEMIVKGESL